MLTSVAVLLHDNANPHTAAHNNNKELMEGVKMWLSSQVTDFFDTGIQKLTP
jgi:hypothetical protein